MKLTRMVLAAGFLLFTAQGAFAAGQIQHITPVDPGRRPG